MKANLPDGKERLRAAIKIRIGELLDDAPRFNAPDVQRIMNEGVELIVNEPSDRLRAILLQDVVNTIKLVRRMRL